MTSQRPDPKKPWDLVTNRAPGGVMCLSGMHRWQDYEYFGSLYERCPDCGAVRAKEEQR